MNKKSKNRILYGALIAVSLLLFLALIVPSFIDANQYKGLIADKARSATGRTLTIEGDMDLSILPTPALSVHRIKLANLEGAASPDMVQLAALRVRVALFPLFTGRVQIESIAMIDPVIELERLADGRANWEFAPPADEEIADTAKAPAERPAAQAGADTDAGGVAQAIQVDRFTIENGTLVYRDGQSGTLERIEKVNADIHAESLVGPFRVDGDFIVRGLPVSLELGAGALVEGPGTPIDLEIGVPKADATLGFSGTLSAPNPTGVLTGTLTAKSANLADLIGAFAEAGAAPLPGALAQEFSYQSSLVGSSSNIELHEIALGFGGATADGSVKMRLGETSHAEAAIRVSKIDLDAWLAMQRDAAPKAVKTTEEEGDASAAGGEGPSGAKKEKKKAAFAFPKNFSGSFNLVTDSIIFQGAAIREARIHASLADGELALDQAVAQLPGGASLSIFGFVSTMKGAPGFEGDLDFRTKNLRSLFNWLRVDLADVPAGRMREAALTAKLAITPERAAAEKLDFKLDDSRLTGMLSAAFAGRPNLRGQLSMNQLNLDSYLGKEKKDAAAGAVATPSAGSEAKQEKAKPKKGDAAGLKVLEDFDADFSFALSRLTYQKQPISGIRLSGMLKNGALTLREASVQDLAGAQAKLSGKAGKFSDTPQFDAELDLRSRDVGQLFRLTGDTPSAAVAKLGPATMQARLAGTQDRLNLNAELGVAKGVVRANGDIGNLPEAPDFNLRLAVVYPNLATLLEVFDYQPQSKLGAMDLKAQLQGTPTSVVLSGLDGQVGPAKLAGKIGAKLDGPRPVITAKLESGAIPAHRFLPAPSRAAASPTPDRKKAAQAPSQSGKGSGHWSKAPLDLSGLRLVDADIDLSAAALIYDNIRVEQPRMGIVLKEGVLNLNKLSGNLFGGAFDASAELADRTPATANGKLVVRNANIKKALFASSGFDLGDGTLNFDLDLKTSGNSEHALVSALNGVAKLQVKDGTVRGFDLDAVSEKLDNLDRPEAFLGLLDTALSGGETRFQDLSGTIPVANGVAEMKDMHMQAQSGTADLTGKVDLPNWHMDLRTDFHLASEPGAPVFALLMKGPLDNPHRRFDTKQFQKHLVKKGIGSLLKKVLPFKEPTAPESAAPAEEGGGEEAPKPEKVIQDLLKGFGL